MSEPLTRDDVLALLHLAVFTLRDRAVTMRGIACLRLAVTTLRAYAQRQRFDADITAFAADVESYATTRLDELLVRAPAMSDGRRS